jgi:hypothetical protein
VVEGVGTLCLVESRIQTLPFARLRSPSCSKVKRKTLKPLWQQLIKHFGGMGLAAKAKTF